SSGSLASHRRRLGAPQKVRRVSRRHGRHAGADRLGVRAVDHRGSHFALAYAAQGLRDGHRVARETPGRERPAASARAANRRRPPASRHGNVERGGPLMLETLDLTHKLDREEYVREVTRRQIQLRELGYQIYLQKRPAIAVFEGWDAAGKGGAIKRITE